MAIPIGAPRNDCIDYERAGLLEQAIRDAARKYSFGIVDVSIRARDNRPPTIEIELQQQPGRVRDAT